jgi:hypothetical protein
VRAAELWQGLQDTGLTSFTRFSGELPPGGLTSSYLGAVLAPGFHVVTRTSSVELSPPQQALVDRCVELATDTPPMRARASCTAQRSCQLAPSATDLATILEFRWMSPGS